MLCPYLLGHDTPQTKGKSLEGLKLERIYNAYLDGKLTPFLLLNIKIVGDEVLTDLKNILKYLLEKKGKKANEHSIKYHQKEIYIRETQI